MEAKHRNLVVVKPSHEGNSKFDDGRIGTSRPAWLRSTRIDQWPRRWRVAEQYESGFVALVLLGLLAGWLAGWLQLIERYNDSQDFAPTLLVRDRNGTCRLSRPLLRRPLAV